jgi:hypothetical protein
MLFREITAVFNVSYETGHKEVYSGKNKWYA